MSTPTVPGGHPGEMLNTMRTDGGTAYVTVAAATASPAGGTPTKRLMRVVTLTLGTAALTLYDGISTAGTPIFTIPASAPVGSIYNLQIPLTSGALFIGGAVNTPSILATTAPF